MGTFNVAMLAGFWAAIALSLVLQIGPHARACIENALHLMLQIPYDVCFKLGLQSSIFMPVFAFISRV